MQTLTPLTDCFLYFYIQNEDTLKACVKEYQGKLQKAEEQLLKLKEVAEEKLKT